MPDVPAIGEVVPGCSVCGWNGMWAPAGTPGEIVSRPDQALARILRHIDIREKLRAESREPAHSTRDGFAHVIAGDVATRTEVVKNGNVKLD
jgi:tripartite-type tricarboxylate transporter receptor subunit TctC